MKLRKNQEKNKDNMSKKSQENIQQFSQILEEVIKKRKFYNLLELVKVMENLLKRKRQKMMIMKMIGRKNF